MEVYNKEDVIAHLNTILPQGYTFETVENAFDFLKTEGDRKIQLSILMNEYFPHDVTYGSIYLEVHFNQVEQIFHDVFVNHPNVDFGHDLNFSKTFGKGYFNTLTENEKYVLRNTQVYNDSTFNQVKPILEKMIDEALSFLDQHPTLKNFYNYGEGLSEDDRIDYYGHPASARIAIVKKLLSLSYTTFLTDEITIYNQHNLTALADFTQDLKDYLDNM